MQEPSKVELSFPCPACNQRITLRQNLAIGPCPFCHQDIEVQFSARLSAAEEDIVSLTPSTFDRRRFRPVSKPHEVGRKASRKLSDQ